ncbi:alpha/beta hydrolase [Agrococcus terreus]|uniref:alpha/beta fold hydrolase n=1 Tax=Agrococcus terreus TaxID=574649 RepID=UPI00384A77C3
MPATRIDGVPTWHEASGAGEPVVLLHGGLSHSGGMRPIGEVLSRTHRVHAFDRRGHGATPRAGAPFTYAAMAAEVVRFLEEVVRGPAHLVGWSDGAVAAVLAALERPDLVRRIVAIDQYLSLDGAPDPDGFEEGMRDPAVRERLRASFERRSPDGAGAFDAALEDSLRLWRTEPAFDLDLLARLRSPVLLLTGDRGEVLPDHAAELVRRIPVAEHRELPGTHLLPLESPEAVAAACLDWLARG